MKGIEMKKLSLLSCVVSLTIGIGLVVLSAKAESATLLGWDRAIGLVSIDIETGELALIIEALDRQIEGLAFDSTNNALYGVEQKWGIEENVLVEINLTNGTISDIGPVGFNEVTAMTFDETTDTIFALDQTTRTLLEIDPYSGESVAIGNFSQGASNGLAAQPITGDLFAAVLVDSGYLARIDKTTGNSTLLGTFGDCHVSALSFHPDTGVLFGKAGGPTGGPFADGRLVTIDFTTGLATPIGAAIGNIVSLAFVEIINGEITIDAILEYFYNSVDAETIEGRGRKSCIANARLWIFGQMLETAQSHLENGRINRACRTLNRIVRRCDGEPWPMDYIEGEAVPELYNMILDLMEIECE
jgi:hypothetical protein